MFYKLFSYLNSRSNYKEDIRPFYHDDLHDLEAGIKGQI